VHLHKGAGVEPGLGVAPVRLEPGKVRIVSVELD
jgi:hypothetical protein